MKRNFITPFRLVVLFTIVVALLLAWRFGGALAGLGPAGLIGRDLSTLWNTAFFHIGEVSVSPALLLKLLVLLILLLYLTRLLRGALRKHVLSRLPFDAGQLYVIERLFSYTVFGIGLMVVLQSAGVHLDSLLAMGAAVGIGIGLGLQTIAKNFASGLVLLLERPVKVGDRVAVGDLLGDVLRIGGRSTWIRTNDNVVIIVPNAEFIENRVINWTANDRRVRVAIPVGVSYSSNPEQVRGILLAVANGHVDVLPEPAPDVVFRGFGDSSLDFELRVWTRKHVQTPKILSSDLYFAIFKAFREMGVEIPFPQRDLHIRTADVPLRIAQADGRPPSAVDGAPAV